eukprot:TRINITY_DN11543_c0_g1_i3.p1 TRINITY_DN11543_c0_g1~~TRINITY_DN11543_c0_g1_i3.p1  ORF type:complete len:2117 (+),score=442.26 TRINITY_DN11543_c0_g1_i3:173-6523(+)
MAPNGTAQEEVIRATLQVAQLLEVGSVEAHGTGTALGDPIEVGALHRVLGGTHQSSSVLLGAFKTQIAHTEGAAGMAGLLKVVHTLWACQMPPNLHLLQPNPKLDLEGFAVHTPSQTSTAVADSMGVSSFGYSGTNSHAVLVCNGINHLGTFESSPVLQYQPTAFAWWSSSGESLVTQAPLLGTAAIRKGQQGTVWERVWPVDTCRFLAQHRVGVVPLAPGTGFLCMVDEAIRGSSNSNPGTVLDITEARFTAMLFLDQSSPCIRVSVVLSSTDAADTVGIESQTVGSEWLHLATVAGHTSQHSASKTSPSACKQPMIVSWRCPPILQPSVMMQVCRAGLSELHSPGIWALQEYNGNEGRAYLQSRQLEVTRTQRHMYSASWVPVSGPETTAGAACTVVWGSDADLGVLCSMFGSESTGARSVEELCALMRAGLHCCCSGDSSMAAMLRGVQVVARVVGAAMWVVVGPAHQERMGRSAGSQGLTQCVNAERGQMMHCVCMEGSVLGLASLMKCCGEESQVVSLTDGERQAARLQVVPKSRDLAGQAVELVVKARGALSSLSVHQQQIRQPGATVRVKAVGLNFRDVLNVLGMYPGDPGPPGGDCAGVASCGSHSSNVLGLTGGSLRSYASTDPRLLARMPAHWSFDEASTMPTVWVTVWMCLEELSGIRSRQNVLVQAATGGVGLVAVQCAQRAGSRVYGTAGRAEKQAYMQSLGVPMVSTTRDGAVFVREMGCVLHGELGLVLNSLTHNEYVPAAAGLLGESGWFVEIGKRGIWTRQQMAGLNRVRYNIVAMDSNSVLDPVWQHVAMAGMDTRAQEVCPLPQHVFNMRTECVDGFRLLHRARQIGKVVVRVDDSGALECASSNRTSFVVSGGTGALGLLVGSWLVRCGGLLLVLLSRSGHTANGAGLHWRQISEAPGGSFGQVALCDVGQERDTQASCGMVEASGLLHSAGVLSDAVLQNQTQAGLQRVWTPKAHAGWNLHNASTEDEQRQFLVFSSIGALLGSAGQANYAAANACLDGLVRLRRQHGLSGTSVQWGAWAGAGMAAGLVDQMLEAGWVGIQEAHGLCALELALSGSVGGVVGMAPAQWSVVMGSVGEDVPAFLQGFQSHVLAVEQEKGSEATTHRTAFVGSVAMCTGEELREAIQGMVLRQVQHAAGVTVGAHDPLMESGVDSLASTELQNNLQRELGSSVKVPSTIFFEYPTVAEVASFLCSEFTENTEVPRSVQTALQPTSASTRTVGVVGMACRLSGGAHSVATLWDSLCSGAVHITDQPPAPWRDVCARAGVDQAIYTGAFIDSVPELEGSNTLAGSDEHLQIMLEVATEGMRDAGWNGKAHHCGLWAAAVLSGFVVPIAPFEVSRTLASALKLTGPHSNMDAACSSGYLALHHATKALKDGVCDRAIVCAASLLRRTEVSVTLLEQGILSASGHMRPFDQSADGMVWGEACSALLLQQGVSPAQSYGCIDGAGVCVNSPLLPFGFADPSAMQEAIARALTDGSIQPAQVALVHMHAMASLGTDVPELMAVGTVLGSDRASPLVLANHKANFGHSVAASGLIGTITLLLAMQQKRVPRHLGVERPLEEVREMSLPRESPVVLGSADPIHGGINGTSISGDNVHLVLRFGSGHKLALEQLALRDSGSTLPEMHNFHSPASAAAAAELQAPDHVSPLNSKLADLASQVAGKPILPDDQLLGGVLTSLQVVQLSRAAQSLGLVFSAPLVVQHNSINAVVAALGVEGRLGTQFEDEPQSRALAIITSAPCSIDSQVVRLGSITKTVTAIAILRLMESGALCLDQPVEQILPYFRPSIVYGTPRVAATTSITIRHLLVHSSGLGYGKVLSLDTDAVDEFYASGGLSPAVPYMDTISGRPLEAISRQLATMPLKFEPGTSFAYSMGHMVLGDVIETLLGQSLSAALQSLVFDPLGITSACFVATLDADVAECDPSTAPSSFEMQSTELELADSGLAMTLRDTHTLLHSINPLVPQHGTPLLRASTLRMGCEPAFECGAINDIAQTPLAAFAAIANWSLLGPLAHGVLITAGAFGVQSAVNCSGETVLGYRDQFLLFSNVEADLVTMYSGGAESASPLVSSALEQLQGDCLAAGGPEQEAEGLEGVDV